MTKVNDNTLQFNASRRNNSIDGDFDYYGGFWEKTDAAGKFNMSFKGFPDKKFEGMYNQLWCHL